MYIEVCEAINESNLNIWINFIKAAGLDPDLSFDQVVLIWDNATLIATGARQDNLLKCIAVSEDRQGEGLTATLITTLRQEALKEQINHLFLYTKPKNKTFFSSLFFYPVAETEKVLLMENRKNGIGDFLKANPPQSDCEDIGCVVMNCNPFTLGHQHLIETAAKTCEHLYIFVVSEDKSEFSFSDRIEMVKLGTAHLKNVTVLPTGPYLISSATFPDYFLKEKDNVEEIHCLLDVAIFNNYYVPHFSIKKRFVGTEPFSQTTDRYNAALKDNLKIELVELPRLALSNTPISASAVREHIASGDLSAVKDLVPKTTFEYLTKNNLI